MDPREEVFSDRFADVALEKQLVACLAETPREFARLGRLRAEHFSDAQLGPVFEAMRQLQAQGERITTNRLMELLHIAPENRKEWSAALVELFRDWGGGNRRFIDLAADARTIMMLAARRDLVRVAHYENGGDTPAEFAEVRMRLGQTFAAIDESIAANARINCSDDETFADLKPPDYLVEGLIQRGFLYGLTGLSGIGKTNVALRIALSIAQGAALGPHAVTDPGPCLYMIAENPDDWRYRLKGIKAYEGIAESGVRNVLGPTRLEDVFGQVAAHIERHGPVRLIVVDTSAAHLAMGTDENDNPGMLAHAKALRRLTELPGRPAVIVVCHPPKNGVTDASMLIPRGGSSFFAELDGNFTLWGSTSEPMEFHFNKLRGPIFQPILFETVSFFTPEVVDARGVQQSCVMARVMSRNARDAYEARHSQDQEDMLVAILEDCDSGPKIAMRCLWRLGNGEPDRKKVQRVAGELKGLIEIVRQRYVLTRKGTDEAERVRTARTASPRGYKD